jgi:hypothetical protein
MKEATPWKGFYSAVADGRFRITTAALLALFQLHPDRIVEIVHGGRPTKVLLLDKPLRLAEKDPESEMNDFFLVRLRLNELPGWPPQLASTTHAHLIPPLLECKLLRASCLAGAGSDPGGLLYSLEHRGMRMQAWQGECPPELLRCAEATLNQPDIRGMKLQDVQHVRIISSADL